MNFFNEITKDDVIIIGLSSSPKLGWGKNIIKIVQLKSLTHARIVLLVPPFINERIFYFGDDVVVIKCHGNIQDVVKKTLTALTTTPEKKGDFIWIGKLISLYKFYSNEVSENAANKNATLRRLYFGRRSRALALGFSNFHNARLIISGINAESIYNLIYKI